MNKIVATESDHIPARLSRILFAMFAYISDSERNVTLPEVRRFQRLVRESDWSESEDLSKALFELRKNYTSYWANYEGGTFAVDVDSIADALDSASRDLGEDRSSVVRRELSRFLDLLDRSPSGVRRIKGDRRSNARRELLTILKLEPDLAGEQVVNGSHEHNGRALVGANVVALPAVAGPPTNSQVSDNTPMPDPQLEHNRIASAAPAAATWPAAAISLGNSQLWCGGKTKVRCVSVVLETHDTKTYSFAAEPQKLFCYKPGQFVTIEVSAQGQTLRRSYTISSSPTRPYCLSITVKKAPMGWMSNWLFDNMAVGVECSLTGPAGNFTCLDYAAKKLLFISAGSGITPVISMLRWLADTSSDTDIVFINNVRTPDDIIFHQELLHLSARLGADMRMAIVPAAISAGRPWHGPVGKFDEITLRSYAPDFAEREAFVCGPPGYMGLVKSLLGSLGFAMDHYHDESFGACPTPVPAVPPKLGVPAEEAPQGQGAASSMASFGIVPSMSRSSKAALGFRAGSDSKFAAWSEILPPSSAASSILRGANATAMPSSAVSISLAPSAPPTANEASAVSSLSKARIVIQDTGDSFFAQPNQTILEAAEASGIILKHSCRSGLCGTCKMYKVSGDVEMKEATILSSTEVECGYILTCVGKPVGNVVISP
jgi:glycine betaine catabolism B